MLGYATSVENNRGKSDKLAKAKNRRVTFFCIVVNVTTDDYVNSKSMKRSDSCINTALRKIFEKNHTALCVGNQLEYE